MPRIRVAGERGLVWLLAAAAAVVRLVPRSGAEPVCRLAGAVWYVLAPEARAAVVDNLGHVLGRPPTLRQVLAVFQTGVLNYWDTLAISGLSRAEVLRIVTLHGLEHLDGALAGGRGAILVGAHLGSVALAAQALPARGYRVVGLLEQTRSPALFDFLARQRQAFGVRLLPASAGGVRELVAALRRGEVVALLTDRDVTGTGPVVEFFGATTRFPDGAAWLATRTGAPLLPAYATRVLDGTFEAWLEPPLPRPSTGDPREATRLLTHAIARRLEYHIASHPEEWTVFQRRWPSRVAR